MSDVYSKLHATHEKIIIFRGDMVKEENRFKPTLDNMFMERWTINLWRMNNMFSR